MIGPFHALTLCAGAYAHNAAGFGPSQWFEMPQRMTWLPRRMAAKREGAKPSDEHRSSPRPRDARTDRGTEAMTHIAVTGTAVEVEDHRRTSPIGSPQRHYHLNPPLNTPSGRKWDDAVVIEGLADTYVYPANVNGEIADWSALGMVKALDDHRALAALGYRIVFQDWARYTNRA